jgi:CDP-2,3-bis-(O-geranylgeranyl)-sn-glycerol synthase
MPLFWYFVEAIWFILPAYAANGLVTLIKGTHPIDRNKKFFDGEPIFGPGKTIEGFIIGCFLGALIATIQMIAYNYIPWEQAPVKLYIVNMSPILGFILGLGAMTGDLVGSFIKRRLKIERGGPAPLLDQEDFLIGALFFTFLFVNIRLEWVIILLLVTPIFHLVANIIAYLIKAKKEPY